jgi:hypothetical protein
MNSINGLLAYKLLGKGLNEDHVINIKIMIVKVHYIKVNISILSHVFNF